MKVCPVIILNRVETSMQDALAVIGCSVSSEQGVVMLQPFFWAWRMWWGLPSGREVDAVQ